MLSNPLVSIIIPTLNRAHLLTETLDSVLGQTYPYWECIVVDDGSTDNTEKIIKEYVKKDSRFQFHHRPKDRLSGGNAARNYGLEVSKGEYIQWFDSDDLMAENHLGRKLEVLELRNVDFVVSKSLNFDDYGIYKLKKYDGNREHELSGKNYILNRVYWFTPDFFIKRKCLKKQAYNEILQSGQETNFFITLLSKKVLKGSFVDECLSFRRLHDESIQQKLKLSKLESYQAKLVSLLASYNSIFMDIDNETKEAMQREIMTVFYQLKLKGGQEKKFLGFTGNLFVNRNPIKASAFFISVVLNSYFNIGYKLFEFSRS